MIASSGLATLIPRSTTMSTINRIRTATAIRIVVVKKSKGKTMGISMSESPDWVKLSSMPSAVLRSPVRLRSSSDRMSPRPPRATERPATGRRARVVRRRAPADRRGRRPTVRRDQGAGRIGRSLLRARAAEGARTTEILVQQVTGSPEPKPPPSSESAVGPSSSRPGAGRARCGQGGCGGRGLGEATDSVTEHDSAAPALADHAPHLSVEDLSRSILRAARDRVWMRRTSPRETPSNGTSDFCSTTPRPTGCTGVRGLLDAESAAGSHRRHRRHHPPAPGRTPIRGQGEGSRAGARRPRRRPPIPQMMVDAPVDLVSVAVAPTRAPCSPAARATSPSTRAARRRHRRAGHFEGTGCGVTRDHRAAPCTTLRQRRIRAGPPADSPPTSGSSPRNGEPSPLGGVGAPSRLRSTTGGPKPTTSCTGQATARPRRPTGSCRAGTTTCCFTTTGG